MSQQPIPFEMQEVWLEDLVEENGSPIQTLFHASDEGIEILVPSLEGSQEYPLLRVRLDHHEHKLKLLIWREDERLHMEDREPDTTLIIARFPRSQRKERS